MPGVVGLGLCAPPEGSEKVRCFCLFVRHAFERYNFTIKAFEYGNVLTIGGEKVCGCASVFNFMQLDDDNRRY